MTVLRRLPGVTLDITERRAVAAPPRPQDRIPDGHGSFEAFVADTSGQLLRTALLLTGERHAAEDLLQTTYAKAFASWRRVRRSDNPVAYCRTILTRTLVSERRLKRSGERPVDVTPDLAAPDQDTSDRLDLLAALARLDHDDRAVLVLRFYEDLSVAQTADLLRIGEAAVRKRSQRALVRLRTLIPDLMEADR